MFAPDSLVNAGQCSATPEPDTSNPLTPSLSNPEIDEVNEDTLTINAPCPAAAIDAENEES